MEEANKVIDPTFKIKIALDTQLLAYLIDESYPSFNRFYDCLKNSPFVDIVCSRFVTFEYIGIRKLEHYLHKVYSSSAGKMNLSSALQYRRDFKAPELDYESCFEDVKKEIEQELKRLNDDFGIQYDDNILHQGLWHPHQELLLSSRLSKEDCLVLLSSIYPQEFIKESHSIFLTNDSQFFDSFCGNTDYRMASIDQVFDENGILKPETFSIKKIGLNSSTVYNLTKQITDEIIDQFAADFIFNQISIKNEHLVLGKTIKCDCSQELKKSMLCFDLYNKKELPEKIYTAILYKSGKEVKLYIHHSVFKDFYHKKKIESFPYIATEDPDSQHITLLLKEKDGSFLEENLMTFLSLKGNIIFIHPDNFI
ncbi:hypothetical protein [Mariniflexile sp.]|uniref:hypothetical protein n=2 Tax=Mariniflexile sp. TaxID=1979402 RepID=UPI004047209A